MIEIQKDNDMSFSGSKKVPGMYLLLMHPEVSLRYFSFKFNYWRGILIVYNFKDFGHKLQLINGLQFQHSVSLSSYFQYLKSACVSNILILITMQC